MNVIEIFEKLVIEFNLCFNKFIIEDIYVVEKEI